MDDGEEVGCADVEETPSGDRHEEGGESGISDISEQGGTDAESERDGECEGSHEEGLYLWREVRFSEKEGEREGDGDLVDGDSGEDGISEFFREKESGSNPDSVENGMDEEGDPTHP